MDSKKLALLCRKFADDKKAENIVVLDVRKLSSVTDYFVIASGSSQPHLRAIVDEITSGSARMKGMRPARTDGATSGAWVVLDYFDRHRPCHAQRMARTQRYDLEGLWNDAKTVNPPKPRKKKTPAE